MLHYLLFTTFYLLFTYAFDLPGDPLSVTIRCDLDSHRCLASLCVLGMGAFQTARHRLARTRLLRDTRCWPPLWRRVDAACSAPRHDDNRYLVFPADKSRLCSLNHSTRLRHEHLTRPHRPRRLRIRLAAVARIASLPW